MMHMRTRQSLTLTDARIAIEAMKARVQTFIEAHPGKGAVMVVCDEHGELIALERTDDAPYTCIANATNKAYSSAREKCPSGLLGEKLQAARKGDGNFDFAFFGDLRMIGWGGGHPIIVDGNCIGAVGISGLPEDVDKEIAADAVQTLLKVTR
jgi:glc operon protein GlcG